MARMTGLGLSSPRHGLREPGDIAPDAVRDTEEVFLDLTRLGPWDRFRVAWARIGAHYFIQEVTSGRNRGSVDFVGCLTGPGVDWTEAIA